MLRPSLLALPLAALPLAAQTVAPASPEPAPPVELSPLEVTSDRFSPAPPEPPAAVTVHGGDFVSGHRIETVTGLAPYTPGFFASEQSVNNPSYGIRGITTDNVDPRSEERVSVYHDGVPISRTSGASVALFDIASVDVVKGPEPTRFVRGVQSGAIDIRTNPAANEKSAALSVSAGSYAARSVEAFVNAPVVENKLFARVAFFAAAHDGYVDNLFPGAPDLQDADTAALRASVRWQPVERTTLDVSFNLQRDTPGGTAFKSIDVPTSLGDTDPYTAAELNRGDELGVDRTITSLSATLRTELSPAWTFSSVSAGRQFDMDEQYDADGSRFYLFELGTDHRDEQLSQEFRFDYDDGGRLTGGFGAGLFWEKGRQKITINTDERRAWALLSGDVRQALIDGGVPPATAGLVVPTLNPFVPDSALPNSLPATFAFVPALAPYAGLPLDARHQERYVTDNDYRSVDLFGDVDYKLTERLTVGGALRLTAESIEGGYDCPDSGTSNIGFILAGGSNNLVYRPTAGRLENTDDNIAWSGRVHATYELAKTHEAFAAVSRGRRPPALGYDQSTLQPVTLEEETVVNYETGVRGALAAGRAAYSVSVFQYYYDGFQTSKVVAPGVVALADGGRARGQGLETTLRGAVNRHLSLFGAYGFTDATFSGQDEDGDPQAYAGNTFRLASRHVLSLGGTVAAPAFDRGEFLFTPVWQYKSETYFEDDNDRSGGRLRQGGFAVVNLTLAYRPRGGAWEAAVFADNVFDKDYLIDAGNLGSSFNLPTTVAGNPRTVGAKFTARF